MKKVFNKFLSSPILQLISGLVIFIGVILIGLLIVLIEALPYRVDLIIIGLLLLGLFFQFFLIRNFDI